VSEFGCRDYLSNVDLPMPYPPQFNKRPQWEAARLSDTVQAMLRDLRASSEWKAPDALCALMESDERPLQNPQVANEVITALRHPGLILKVKMRAWQAGLDYLNGHKG
jgi:hypothetical protein